MRLFTKRLWILSFGLLVTACGPRQYYIPVDNRLGNAAPISQNDIVRVLIPHNLPEITRKIRENGKDWENYMEVGLFERSAKGYTEKKLINLGYHLINTDKYLQSNQKPTVIVLVYSSHDVSKDHDLVELSYTPTITDEYGQPTMWQTNTDFIPMRQINYKIKLIRPVGKDNPLLKCDNQNPLGLGLCIAPEHPENYPYQTIFEGYGTMDTNAKDPSYILDHLTTGVLYNYPNLIGKKRVYLYTQPAPQVIKVEDAPAEKKK